METFEPKTESHTSDHPKSSVYRQITQTDINYSYTTFVDDIERAVNDVMELEGVICFSEALYVERIVLKKIKKEIRFLSSLYESKSNEIVETREYLMPNDSDAHDHLLDFSGGRRR